ncbi:MAG: hypothetical protein ACOYBE_10600 [Blautia sp.]
MLSKLFLLYDVKNHIQGCYSPLNLNEIFLTDSSKSKSISRRQLDKKLDTLSDADLVIVESVADGITKAKKMEEK